MFYREGGREEGDRMRRRKEKTEGVMQEKDAGHQPVLEGMKESLPCLNDYCPIGLITDIAKHYRLFVIPRSCAVRSFQLILTMTIRDATTILGRGE